MKSLKLRWTPSLIAGIMGALLLGGLLHELFKLCPTIVTEFFATVNESIWEHIKVVFWPLLLLVPAVTPKERHTEALFSPVVSSLVMLLLGWVYHIRLGGTWLVVDLLIFLLVILLGFLLPLFIRLPKGAENYVLWALIILIGLIFAFTITPPHGALFKDAALVEGWVTLIC